MGDDGSGVSALVRQTCGGTLQNLRGILDRLLRLDLRILLNRPSLELPKQGFRLRLAIFRLILIGGLRGINFVANWCVLCDRRQCLSIGGRFNRRCRPIGSRLDSKPVNKRSRDLSKQSYGILRH